MTIPKLDDENITDAFARFAAENPSAVAVFARGGAMTFGELDDYVWRVAAHLASQGIRAGDGLALAFRYPTSHLTVALALARIGANQFSVDPFPLNEGDVLAAKQMRLTSLVTDIDGFGIDGLTTLKFGQDWFSNGGPVPDESLRSTDPELGCFLASSSGTTGEPKFVSINHRQFLGRVLQAGLFGFSAGDRFLSLIRLVTFVQMTLCFRALMSGATVHLGDRDVVNNLSEYCDRHRISHIHIIPWRLREVLPLVKDKRSFRHVRNFVFSGSAVTQTMLNAAVERITPNVSIAYGCTEAGTISYAVPEDRKRYPLAVGRIADGVEVRIVGPDGQPVPANTVGEIEVRNPGMIDEYPGQPGPNAHYFHDGWFRPGDLVSMSDDGILQFHGRADDMMNFNGYNIYPVEIERVLDSHPAVAEAAVVSIRSPVHQDVPVAAVVLENQIGSGELLDYCRHTLGYRAPVRIVAVDAIPLSDRGKVDKKKLAATLAEMLTA